MAAETPRAILLTDVVWLSMKVISLSALDTQNRVDRPPGWTVHLSVVHRVVRQCRTPLINYGEQCSNRRARGTGVHTHASACMDARTHGRARTHTDTHTHTHPRTHAHTHMHTHVRTCTHMYAHPAHIALTALWTRLLGHVLSVTLGV